MIKELTKQQEEDLQVFRRKMLDVGLDCGDTNEDEVKKAISRLYKKMNKKEPIYLFFDSPLSCNIVCNMLNNKEVISQLNAQLYEQLRGQLSELRDQLCNRLRNQVHDQLSDRVYKQLRELCEQLYEQLCEQLREQLRDRLCEQLGELHDQLGEQLGEQLGDQLREQLREQLGDQLYEQLCEQLGGQLYEQLHGQLYEQLRDRLCEQLGELHDQLGEQLGEQLRGQLGEQLREQLRGQLGDQLGEQLGGQLREQIKKSKLNYISTWFWGQQDNYWIAFYRFCERIGAKYTQENGDLLNDWYVLAENVMWWYPFENHCVISRKAKKINWDYTNNCLHSYKEPAIEFNDGWKLYYINGLEVDEEMVVNPKKITVDEIKKESNIEMRRIKIQAYDNCRYVGAYLNDSGAKLIHENELGRLYKKENDADEPIVMVKVLNSTPRNDGSRHEYFLRVPPTIKSVTEAVAWTFEMKAKDYKPMIET
jgi:hypothetical protein